YAQLRVCSSGQMMPTMRWPYLPLTQLSQPQRLPSTLRKAATSSATTSARAARRRCTAISCVTLLLMLLAPVAPVVRSHRDGFELRTVDAQGRNVRFSVLTTQAPGLPSAGCCGE